MRMVHLRLKFILVGNKISLVDSVAVPDFEATAMENWGLILYQEPTLLYDPQESSSSNKQTIATVVAHELAHLVGTQ